MTKSIACTTGIYQSAYELITHKDGSVSVKAPYIKWTRDGANGNLAYQTYGIADADKPEVLKFFEADTLVLEANNNAGALTLQDILDGNRAEDVHVQLSA
jgi:hypothetical protein